MELHLYQSQCLFIYIVLSSLLLLISELVVTLVDGKPGLSAKTSNIIFFFLHGFSSLPFNFFYFLQRQDLSRDYLTGLPNRKHGDEFLIILDSSENSVIESIIERLKKQMQLKK
jgi:hypothetical protein